MTDHLKPEMTQSYKTTVHSDKITLAFVVAFSFIWPSAELRIIHEQYDSSAMKCNSFSFVPEIVLWEFNIFRFFAIQVGFLNFAGICFDPPCRSHHVEIPVHNLANGGVRCLQRICGYSWSILHIHLLRDSALQCDSQLLFHSRPSVRMGQFLQWKRRKVRTPKA